MSYPQNGPLRYDNDKYRFGCCHIRNWAIRIGIFQIVSILLNVASSFWRNPFNSSAYFAVNISLAIICVVTISLMIHGVKKEKAGFVIPNLVLQICIIIGCIIFATLMFMAIPQLKEMKAEATDKDDANLDDQSINLAYGMGIAFVIGCVFQIFFTYVYFRCYRYLVEIRYANSVMAPLPMPHNYPVAEVGVSNPVYSVYPPGNPPGYPPAYPPPYPPAYPPNYTAEHNVEKEIR